MDCSCPSDYPWRPRGGHDECAIPDPGWDVPQVELLSKEEVVEDDEGRTCQSKQERPVGAISLLLVEAPNRVAKQTEAQRNEHSAYRGHGHSEGSKVRGNSVAVDCEALAIGTQRRCGLRESVEEGGEPGCTENRLAGSLLVDHACSHLGLDYLAPLVSHDEDLDDEGELDQRDREDEGGVLGQGVQRVLLEGQDLVKLVTDVVDAEVGGQVPHDPSEELLLLGRDDAFGVAVLDVQQLDELHEVGEEGADQVAQHRHRDVEEGHGVEEALAVELEQKHVHDDEGELAGEEGGFECLIWDWLLISAELSLAFLANLLTNLVWMSEPSISGSIELVTLV
eukprot:CAMPEP_0168619924 /NCGR_PEP_ID=MMETSP0449_2-20121227/6859_1 /TAXON_ID=1082188 /ORGANISM="Strombidium rassoulzadegani, Strain ras09" /LENGTH=337 /DNA_ID=CAMNT_0008660887 /DNA_START=42 /DNA_END=1057 /DNA_ORIENTATION=-